jgi:hypothetical protein
MLNPSVLGLRSLSKTRVSCLHQKNELEAENVPAATIPDCGGRKKELFWKKSMTVSLTYVIMGKTVKEEV